MCVFLLVVFTAPQQETTLASSRRTSRKPLPGPAALGSLRSPSLRRPRKRRSDREEPNYRTNFTPANAEEEIRISIGKFDSAIGHLYEWKREYEIIMQARMLAGPHLGPTPETDAMVLIRAIESNLGKIRPEVINQALGSIADILEAHVRLGPSIRAHLLSLIKSLPNEASGQGAKILQLIEHKSN